MWLPYTVDVPMSRLPWANWCLILATAALSCAVFFGAFAAPATEKPEKWDVELQKLEKKGEVPPELGAAARIAKRLFAKASRSSLALQPSHFAVLQLVTHLLIHTNVIHFVINVVFLFAFGNAVNAKLGHVLFLLSYFGLGMIAGAMWLAWSDGRPLAEASGAVMGMMGMFLVFYPRNEVRCIRVRGFSLGRTINIASIWVIALYLISDFIGTLFSGGGKAYLVHLTGGVAGILWAMALVYWRWLPPAQHEENLLEVMGR